MIAALKRGKSTAANGSATERNGSGDVHRFTVAEYHQMVEAGILTADHKVELLNGRIVDKMPQNPPHAVMVTRLTRWLCRVLPESRWSVRVQGPITLADSEPEPDVVVARGADNHHAERHPGPEDVALLIEVADSSVLKNRRAKAPLYAEAGISEFWLVNLPKKKVELYQKPQGSKAPRYRSIAELAAGDTLSLTLDGKEYAELKIKQLLS